MGERANEVRSMEDIKASKAEASRVTSIPHSDEAESDNSQEATEIRSGIEETRSNLSATINALQDKLDPVRIADQVKDQIREKATEAYDTAKTAVKEATIGKAERIVSSVSEAVTDITGRAGTAMGESSSSAVEYIRTNPIPFLLLGAGLGMLAMNKHKSEPSSSSGNRAQGAASGVASTVSNAATTVADTARAAAERTSSALTSAAGKVSDVASSAADTARQQLHDVNHQTQQGVRAAGNLWSSTLQESPLTVGIVALAAGALVGMTVPTTQVEGEYMGEARDRLFDRAKSLAQDTAGKVGRLTEQAGGALKDAAQKEGLVSG